MLVGIVESYRSLKERKEGKRKKREKEGKNRVALSWVGLWFSHHFSGIFLEQSSEESWDRLSIKDPKLGLRNWQRFSKRSSTLEVKFCKFLQFWFWYLAKISKLC